MQLPDHPQLARRYCYSQIPPDKLSQDVPKMRFCETQAGALLGRMYVPVFTIRLLLHHGDTPVTGPCAKSDAAS
jgi:hypothetical protein